MQNPKQHLPVQSNLGDLRITRGWIIRVIGSAVILAGLLWYLPTDQLWSGLVSVGPALFLTVFVLFLVGHSVAAFKWLWLLSFDFPYAIALRAHFAGLAANLCLPGVAGGDVVRAALVSGYKSLSELTAGSLGDRLIDMLALALLALAGVLMLQDGSNTALAVQLVVLFAVAVLGVFYVAPTVGSLVLQKFANLPARALLDKMLHAFGALGKRPGTLMVALSLSLAIQAGFIWLTILLAQAAGLDVPVGVWFFAWPIAKILAVLPISLGGIGVREVSLSALMVPFGADAALVVAASLIWQAVLICAGILGAIALAVSTVRPVRGAECRE